MTPTQLLTVTMSDVIAGNPAAARLLVQRGMACVGCAFAPFDTVADVACVYGVDPLALAADLIEAGAATGAPGGIMQ